MWRHAVRNALPGLRVIALAYTGLGGIAALALMISVAVVPAAPILQEVAEPVRQAVTNLITLPLPATVQRIQPAAPTPVPFTAMISLDINIESTDTIPEEVAEPTPIVVARPSTFPIRVPQVSAPPAVEDQPVEDEQPEDAPMVPQEQPDVVQALESPTLRIASAEPPKALPTPLTPQQLKAQMDAANQAAIDAAKAAQAQAKAQAEAANQAAIDAARRAAVANVPDMADAALTLPVPTAKVSAKAMADAAKLAVAKARAEADAGNQAAIDAAKAAAKSAKH